MDALLLLLAFGAGRHLGNGNEMVLGVGNSVLDFIRVPGLGIPSEVFYDFLEERFLLVRVVDGKVLGVAQAVGVPPE